MAAAPVPPAVPAPVPPTPPLSQGARIVDTFIAPTKTFTDIRRSASWWAPWILIGITAVVFGFAMGKQVGFVIYDLGYFKIRRLDLDWVLGKIRATLYLSRQRLDGSRLLEFGDLRNSHRRPTPL